MCHHRLAELPWGDSLAPAVAAPPALAGLWIPSGSAPGTGGPSDHPTLEGRRKGSGGPSATLGSGQSTSEESRVRAVSSACCPPPCSAAKKLPFPPPLIVPVGPRVGQLTISR